KQKTPPRRGFSGLNLSSVWTELDLAVIAHRSFVARQSGNSGRFAVGAEADAPV
ncbi:MAG: hypothetical protein RL716_201, partial [Actinomycetota bacterium]